MTTTYIVARTDGSNPRCGLSMEDAAAALLSAGGRVYSIEFRYGMYEIQGFSRLSGEAWALQPIRAGGRFQHPTLRALYTAVLSEEWNGYCAMPEAELDALLAALAAED